MDLIFKIIAALLDLASTDAAKPLAHRGKRPRPIEDLTYRPREPEKLSNRAEGPRCQRAHHTTAAALTLRPPIPGIGLAQTGPKTLENTGAPTVEDRGGFLGASHENRTNHNPS